VTDSTDRVPTNDDGDRGSTTSSPAGRFAGVLRPARGLPSSRAVVGGLLVAVALIGTWWAASGGRSTSTERYLVAARRIGPGQEVGRADLAWMTGELPDRLRSRAFTEPASVLGQVTTAPLEAGDLVQASSVVRSAGVPASRELSFVVDTDWAVGGTLRAGDRIDLLVTYGDGASSQTRRVLADTVVRRVSDPGGDSLGSTRTQAITIALDDDDLVREATNAARAGTITVVRATGARSEPRSTQTAATRPTTTSTTPATTLPTTTAPPSVPLPEPPVVVGP
jgi:Flp pilus assembly protein CpaB